MNVSESRAQSRPFVPGKSILQHGAFDPIAHALARMGYVLPGGNVRRHSVYLVLNGQYKGKYGKAHEIATKLGMKPAATSH